MLERALEELDPEIFLLAAEPGSDEDPLEVLLALLHDVPAGKLAIADLPTRPPTTSPSSSARASTACSSPSGNVAALVGAEPPDV